RDEWKFGGLVVSDYESITEMVRHGYARDARDAAREALSASVDMEMVSTSYFDHLKSLVESGEISLPMIDAAVRRILELKFRLGLFDQRAQSTTPAQPAQESREVARRLATESAVLLKNDGNVLPISGTNTKVAVIGPLADSPVDQMGTWVMDARTEDVETPLTSLRRALGNSHVIYAKAMANSRDIRHDGFAEALAAARQADVVLLFLGEEQILSGEAHSRAFLDLPGAQEALVEEIAKAGKPMVGILQAGRPMTFHNAAARLNAVLYAWHPGTVGGPAIADLRLGRANPSGKLPMTFPRTVGQVPIYYNHLNTGRPASTGELGIPLGNPVNPTGYTSKYVDVDFTPEYPFGYGLSYTRFEYSGMRLSTNRLRMGATLEVSAEVRNSGSREGDEVVQLYVRDLVGSVARPVRELKGFRRVHLKAGEKQTVHFSLSTADLAFYNDRMQLVAEPGDFQVWIAPDSASGVEGAFRVE
ncbi:MAG TPA: glycoside hydrolase family 3 C-terminal domain-containing protein, partial [Bryobacteraceae bacterium]|nr:glycoside hydrolase family 3 C-terminal domain-containing protein [Bryobacteraceae bacterium]